MKHHYAIEWPYGVAVSADTGRDIKTVHRFESAAERDLWVEDGGDGRTQPRYREAVTRREVEADIRRAERRIQYSRVSPWDWPYEIHPSYPSAETLAY